MVTHAFHPLRGRTFELVGYSHSWGDHRVFFRESDEQRLRSMPAAWTDVEGPDAFLVLASGRTCFRVEDLLELAGLLAGIDRGCQ